MNTVVLHYLHLTTQSTPHLLQPCLLFLSQFFYQSSNIFPYIHGPDVNHQTLVEQRQMPFENLNKLCPLLYNYHDREACHEKTLIS